MFEKRYSDYDNGWVVYDSLKGRTYICNTEDKADAFIKARLTMRLAEEYTDCSCTLCKLKRIHNPFFQRNPKLPHFERGVAIW